MTLVELPYAGLYDRISTELQAGNAVLRRRGARRDLADAPSRPAMAPLDDLFTDDVKSDLFGGLVTEAQVDGTLRRACRSGPTPRSSSTARTCSRTPTNKADFEAKYGYPLAPPTTWEQYTDIAEFFTRDTDGDGAIDLYGTDVKGAVETEWLATCLRPAKRTWCSTPTGEVTIDDAAHKEALDFYVSLLPVRALRERHSSTGPARRTSSTRADRDDAVLGPRLPADPG